ncbi:MAG: hypothetical protein KAI43_07315 [Candidatus Aureabacteria bacterium]|nr:hypothetical protein [Candidatus Auribacterota bacterium]
MQHEVLQQELEKKIVIELVDNKIKLTQTELKVLWEAIECGQNIRSICWQCGKPCGKTISTEYTCELMKKLKSLADSSASDVNSRT